MDPRFTPRTKRLEPDRSLARLLDRGLDRLGLASLVVAGACLTVEVIYQSVLYAARLASTMAGGAP